MTTWLVFAYLLGGMVTAAIVWRQLGAGFGHDSEDPRRTAEAFIFWPIVVPFLVWAWFTQRKEWE